MASLFRSEDVRKFFSQVLVVALGVAVVGCSRSNTSGAGTETVEGMATPIKMVLKGAGASAPAPLYERWFDELAQQGVRVSYFSVGSGVGLQQFLYGAVDFAASDVPMTAQAIASVPKGVVQVPMTAGAISVAYHNPGCDLQLSQAQLVGIFLGTITNYGQLGCGAKPIQVVVRSDGSGTTANFTAHLAAIDPVWRQKVGTGKLVPWPLGLRAKGNGGVADQLKERDGALGYVEASFVKPPLQSAALTNASGQVVRPTPESKREALASLDLGPHLTGSNPNPKTGYPLVSLSWILLYKIGNGPTNQAALTKVFGYALSEPAQAMADKMGYISLPPGLLEKSRATLATIQP